MHVHVPAGAVPKDGPSAGVTMATAIASLVRGVPVSDDVGMTGELTLTGQVLAIGGVREKVLAAQRAGLKRVILPRENEHDLDDLPAETRRELTSSSSTRSSRCSTVAFADGAGIETVRLRRAQPSKPGSSDACSPDRIELSVARRVAGRRAAGTRASPRARSRVACRSRSRVAVGTDLRGRRRSSSASRSACLPACAASFAAFLSSSFATAANSAGSYGFSSVNAVDRDEQPCRSGAASARGAATVQPAGTENVKPGPWTRWTARRLRPRSTRRRLRE